MTSLQPATRFNPEERIVEAYDLGWADGWVGRDCDNPYEKGSDQYQDYQDGFDDGSAV